MLESSGVLTDFAACCTRNICLHKVVLILTLCVPLTQSSAVPIFAEGGEGETIKMASQCCFLTFIVCDSKFLGA